jgi:hypothetical protein
VSPADSSGACGALGLGKPSLEWSVRRPRVAEREGWRAASRWRGAPERLGLIGPLVLIETCEMVSAYGRENDCRLRPLLSRARLEQRLCIGKAIQLLVKEPQRTPFLTPFRVVLTPLARISSSISRLPSSAILPARDRVPRHAG